ncbi:hypothetical protein CYMTET_8180 [Cymbomonas tetramitiformis]|uniref:Integrase catalytic domain-containing protein n=1 Tax=Cymbomonas tetramitiformis TaxID=36881 RepID=A0AAE0GU18_9CHLO|nr:hypothetical protein CYMTET_8180 [Cymbomonas tetramitiformis]
MCGESRVWVRETKWPVVVIYKDGHTVMKLDAKMLAHIRLGHIGDVTMHEMLDEEVPMGITIAQYAKSLVWRCPERCISCRLIRPSMKSTGRESAAEIGLLVWSDTCGPFKPSAGGYRWFVLFVDDCTTWICVYFLKRKSDYLAALEKFLAEVRQHRSRMRLEERYHMVLHTDGDSTMIAGQTQQYCKDQGIEQRHGSPYLHENQARVERSHRTVQAMARALLLTSGFGVDMWPLAVRHSVYILNRTFQKPLHKKSPYYKLYGQHRDLSHLRVFGCLAYAFVDPDSREHKLSDRARQLRYVGHFEVSSAYLLYDPESGKIVKSGMVKFHEVVDKLGKVVTTWDPSAVAFHGDDVGCDEILAVLKVQAVDEACWVSLRAYLHGHPEHLAVVSSAAHGDLNVDYPLFTEVTVDAGGEKMEAGIICARAVEASSFPYCVMLLSNFTHIDLPVGKVHFPPEHTCLAAVEKSCAGSSVDVLPDGVTEPKSVKQAMEAPDAGEWMDAIQTELEALVAVKQALLMMDMEDVSPGVRLLDMSLVLKVKLDKHRQLQKRKARVCVRGNKQEYGVDYFDTPCTQLSSVRLVIILALNLALEGRTCAKLLKAVYGLKHAGKEWFETSDAFIMGYDERMRRSDVEPCLYYIRDSDITVIILAYVDDYLVATNSRSWYDNFVAAFNSQYACKDLGVLDLVMGIGVRWGPGVAYLSQSGYISQMIETYGLKDAKPASLPMSPGEVKYIINVLTDLVDICTPVQMYCDNQGAIHLASDYVNNNRSKHIEVRNMYIRELVKSKMVEAMAPDTRSSAASCDRISASCLDTSFAVLWGSTLFFRDRNILHGAEYAAVAWGRLLMAQDGYEASQSACGRRHEMQLRYMAGSKLPQRGWGAELAEEARLRLRHGRAGGAEAAGEEAGLRTRHRYEYVELMEDRHETCVDRDGCTGVDGTCVTVLMCTSERRMGTRRERALVVGRAPVGDGAFAVGHVPAGDDGLAAGLAPAGSGASAVGWAPAGNGAFAVRGEHLLGSGALAVGCAHVGGAALAVGRATAGGGSGVFVEQCAPGSGGGRVPAVACMGTEGCEAGLKGVVGSFTLRLWGAGSAPGAQEGCEAGLKGVVGSFTLRLWGAGIAPGVGRFTLRLWGPRCEQVVPEEHLFRGGSGSGRAVLWDERPLA